MKFDCGETYLEMCTSQANWHKWFAWYPVRVGPRDCRWFEIVERKITREFYIWDTLTTREYRPIKKGN